MKDAEQDLARKVARKAKEKADRENAEMLERVRSEFYVQLARFIDTGKIETNRWHVDVGTPDVELGNQTDLYLDKHNGLIYLKRSGKWEQILDIKGKDGKDGAKGETGKTGERGATGFKGARGEQGVAGKDGKDGIDGRDGIDGKDGKDGTKWFTGSGKPSSSLGEKGDFYLDSKTGDYYEKTGNLSWTKRGNLRGPEGESGRGGGLAAATKESVGLGNVDNTSDADKPVSTAQQAALDDKADQTEVDGKATGAASSTDNAIARFDGTTGKVIQNSTATVDDNGTIRPPGGVIVDGSISGRFLSGNVFGFAGAAVYNAAGDEQVAFALIPSGLMAALGFDNAGLVSGPGGSTPFDIAVVRSAPGEFSFWGSSTEYGNIVTAMLKRNAGSPEGSVTAGVGALCNDTTNGDIYVKVSGTGNTGWVKLVRTDKLDSRQFTSGTWHNQAISASGNGVIAGVADRIQVAPLRFSQDVEIDQWGIEVTTAVASAEGRIVLYDSDGTDGAPNTLLDSSSALDLSTTGVKAEANSYTFLANKLYWLGVHHSSTASLRGIVAAATENLGQPSTFGNNNIRNHYRSSNTFASGAPATLSSPNLQSAVIPQVGLRVA